MKLYRRQPGVAREWIIKDPDSATMLRLAANTGEFNEPDNYHFHEGKQETYIFVRGTATIKVNDKEIKVTAGDVVTVDPGEKHAVLHGGKDLEHFVVQLPCVSTKHDSSFLKNLFYKMDKQK